MEKSVNRKSTKQTWLETNPENLMESIQGLLKKQCTKCCENQTIKYASKKQSTGQENIKYRQTETWQEIMLKSRKEINRKVCDKVAMHQRKGCRKNRQKLEKRMQRKQQGRRKEYVGKLAEKFPKICPKAKEPLKEEKEKEEGTRLETARKVARNQGRK